MAAYRADIEIGVRGVRSLEQLRSSINQTAQAVDSLNEVVSARGSLVQNIQNYTNNLDRAARSLRLVGAGTEAETKAVREYVRALGEANTARARQNSLIVQEVASQRRINPQTAPYGQQGPALPPALVRSQQIQQNWNRFFQEAAQVGQELQTTAAAKTINIKTSWNRFFQEATDLSVELTIQAQRASAAIKSKEGIASATARQRLSAAAEQRQRIQNAGFGIQGPALPPGFGAGPKPSGKLGSRLGGAISGGIIGGAFPLLFGQGGGAAAGGAIGGLVGGLAGPGGSFAGSLLGTLLGDIASRGQAVKQLADDIGFSAQQTKQLSSAFKVANTDVEKFTAVIQNIRGVGLEIEDQAKAIQLITRLTELYGGSFEKTGNAITTALESGKVTQATLNQLTSQGINIQQALADKFGISRDKILQLAKDGDISVQTLIDTLVQLGNTTTQAINKPVSATDVLNQRFETLTARITASAGSINTSLSPAYAALIKLTADALKVLDDYIVGLQTLATSAAQYITPVVNKFIEVKDAITGAQIQLPGFVSAIAAWAKEIVFALNPALRVLDFIRNKGTQQKTSATATGLYGRYAAPENQVTKLSTFNAPSQMTGGDSTAKKAVDEAKKLAEQRQKQLEIAARAAVLADGELQKAVAVTDQEKLNTDYAFKRMERMVKYEKLYKEALSQAEIEYYVLAQTSDILAEKLNYEKQILDIALKQSAELNKVDPLASYQEELNLLAAKIQGKEEEYTIQKKINDLIAAGTDPEIARNTVLTIQDLDKQNKAIENQKQLWADIYTTVSGELQNAVKGLIEGTTQWGDVLSSILGSLGNLFLNAAFSGLGSALKLPGFASGGFVTSPTTAVVGEGGQPEYVIPASKMRTAMSRYAAGARGSSVVSGSGGQISSENGGGTATMQPIDVRYTVERINSVDYVTADQFRAGMQQAAIQGAQRGEQATIRRLKQSQSTRSRLGI